MSTYNFEHCDPKSGKAVVGGVALKTWHDEATVNHIRARYAEMMESKHALSLAYHVMVTRKLIPLMENALHAPGTVLQGEHRRAWEKYRDAMIAALDAYDASRGIDTEQRLRWTLEDA